jgi:dTDP-4-dehydrorhamnose 3,5-epimerase-like enzyme
MDPLNYPRATPVRQHGDDRRLAWLEVLGDLLPGDLNVTTVYPGAKLGWHRHWHQDDYMLVVAGTLKVGCWREIDIGPEDEVGRDLIWTTLDARHPQTYRIPAGWWHGYMALGGEATIITYITQHYNPDDEARMPMVHTPEMVWDTVPR